MALAKYDVFYDDSKVAANVVIKRYVVVKTELAVAAVPLNLISLSKFSLVSRHSTQLEADKIAKTMNGVLIR